ncbi:MAG: DUF2158 domain-containing protein [Methylococcales bacterium]|nr:DUF2158 domain-containing protein [Methylococcales bacterium]
MRKYITGDVVKLKSGSPNMTVVRYKNAISGGKAVESDNVECTWFDENELKTAIFHENTLDKTN